MEWRACTTLLVCLPAQASAELPAALFLKPPSLCRTACTRPWCIMSLLVSLCDMTHSYMCHDSFICVTWLIYMCDMTYSFVWHDWFRIFMYKTWLFPYSYVWHDASRIHMWDMTHSAFTCVHDLFLIHMCDMTHSFVWHDSCICVTWFICICHMTHSYVWHDSFICVTWLVPHLHT